MGASVSKQTVDLLTEISTNITVSNVQDLRVAASQEMTFNVTGSFVKGSQFRQQMAFDVKALQKSVNYVELQNKVMNEFAQKAKAKSAAFQAAVANNAGTIKNIIRTTVTYENINKCAVRANQKMTANIKNSVVVDTTVDQSMTIFVQCFQNTINTAVKKTDLVNKVDQHAEAENKGLFKGIFGDLFSGIFGIILLIIVVLVLGAGGIFLLMRMRSKPPNEYIKKVPVGYKPEAPSPVPPSAPQPAPQPTNI